MLVFRFFLSSILFFSLSVSSTELCTDYSKKEFSESCCPVIGNTNSKIYHVSEGRFYKRMLIKNKRKDNRLCFKTEPEARKSGFRKSKR